MTISASAAPDVGVTATGAAPSPARRAVPGGRVALLLAALAVLFSGWYVAARQATHAVSMSYGALTCSSGHPHPVRVTPEGGDDAIKAPSLPLVRGQRCQLPVIITNRGFTSVDLRGAGLPGLGAGSHQAIQVVRVGRARPTGRGADVFVPLDHTLAPGESTTLRIELAYRDAGCTDDRLVIEGLPTLRTSALHLDQSLRAPLALVLQGTPASACHG